jgi:hypothetical protein
MKPKSSDFVSDAFGLARHSRDVRVKSSTFSHLIWLGVTFIYLRLRGFDMVID